MVLFLGIIVGIQIASNNLVQMTGDERFSTSSLIASKQDETEVGGYQEAETKLTSHDLHAKQQKLEEIETFNFFSQLGIQLSEILNKLFSLLFDKVSSAIEMALS